MSAEPIARMVEDLRAGRVRLIPTAQENPSLVLAASAQMAEVCPTIDGTALYRSLADNPHPVALYEDHPNIAPPFGRFNTAYVNEHGNVMVMCSTAVDWRDGGETATFTRTVQSLEDARGVSQPSALWKTAEATDWDRVRWTIDTILWLGGRSAAVGGPFPTTGPMYLWRFAVYEDGSPADLHWIDLTDGGYDSQKWDMAHLVLLGTLNFLGARNVEIAEPRRPRAEARRILRTGVAVSELVVYPSGRSTRSGGTRGDGAVPLTSVRGHWSHFGACCPHHEPKGLLFGKYTARVWVPSFVRGDPAVGERLSNYRLEEQDA